MTVPARLGVALGLAAALAGAVPAASDPPARAEERGRIVLTHPDPRFGGLSGLVVGPDGLGFAAVSDRGTLVTGTFVRREGELAGAEIGSITALRRFNGEPVRSEARDAEGLAADPAGGLLVSFEVIARIVRFPAPGMAAERVGSCDGFADLQQGSGLEALARMADGTLLAIPERSGAHDRPFPVFRLRNGVCDTVLRIPRRPPFLVTGADVGPDGRLYIVERDFTLLGFMIRIRRFAIGAEAISEEETLLEAPRGRYGNLEGISAWRDPEGFLRLTLVADDNFSAFQRTEIVEFRLSDPPVPPRPGPGPAAEPVPPVAAPAAGD